MMKTMSWSNPTNLHIIGLKQNSEVATGGMCNRHLQSAFLCSGRFTLTDLRYPIGKFDPSLDVTETGRQELIEGIAAAPVRLRQAISGLSPEQLDAPYRPEGWTVRQTAHHLADSHINGYVRCKLALTEAEPAIKTYAENLWAELTDGRDADPAVSLSLLDALHERWVMLLRALSPENFARTLYHPEWGVLRLDVVLALYDWHGCHHTAHITELRRRSGW
jgi:uncharacterized damage-inducible protein DinB